MTPRSPYDPPPLWLERLLALLALLGFAWAALGLCWGILSLYLNVWRR